MEEQALLDQKRLRSTQDKVESMKNEMLKSKAKVTSNPDNLKDDLKTLISERFNQIEKNIDQLITKKLQENATITKETEEKMNVALDQNQSYANAIEKNLDAGKLQTVLEERKNNELIQEKEREKRSTNIIIYGIDENANSEEENVDNQNDKNFINSFMETIGLNVEPKQIVRIGKAAENKKRPLKLVMNNKIDKENVMKRLGNLKSNENYRGISVRDDYTLEERELIKEWVAKANDKNKKENTDEWKVRGTPKNGLRLVRIAKRV